MKLKLLIATTLLATSLYAQERIEKEFKGVDKIDITTASGDCEFKKSSGNQVIVVLEHYYNKENYNPIIELNGGSLKISERSHGSYSGKSPKWTISVPDNLEVKISTGSGNLSVYGLAIELSMSTGSGDVKFDDIKGELKVNTGSGDFTLSKFNGTIRVNTGSGEMNINSAKGEIKLNAGSGDIRIKDAEGGIFANVGSGEIEVEDLIVTEECGFNSGSGDVLVILKSSPKADLKANSGSGNAKIDFNGNKMVGELVMEADKRQGEINAPFEFDTTEEFESGRNTKIVKTKKFDDSDVRIKIGTGSGEASVTK